MKNYTVYKQRLCAAALFLFIFFSAFGTANASWDGTTTTPVSPDKNVYKIYTAEQLAWVAQEVNSSDEGAAPFAGYTVTLMNDIDLSKTDGSKNLWTPIGGFYEDNGAAFCGSFDGQGYGITNMLVSSDAYLYAGLFGYVSGSVEVKNLTVAGSVRNANKRTGYWLSSAGCIAGGASGAAFKNCRASGDVTIESTNYHTRAGLVCGTFDGDCRAENITASGTVSTVLLPDKSHDPSFVHAGGITGRAGDSALINCECSAAINIDAPAPTAFCNVFAALICGWLQDSSVKNARADGAITLNSSSFFDIQAGGVAGYGDGNGYGDDFITIYNCSTNVRISGGDSLSASIGGTIGFADNMRIKNTFANGGCETTADGEDIYIGGVCGTSWSNAFENCASAFTAGKYGLVAGFGANGATLTNCGWLDSSAEAPFNPEEEEEYVTIDGSIASFDAEAMASKIVVAALPQDMRLDMTVGAGAEAKLITYPADGGTGLQNVALALPAEPAGFASIIYEAANSFKVAALGVGNGLLSFSAKLLPTLFDGNFEERAEAVDISPAMSMNVRDFALTPISAAIGTGGTVELTASGGYADSGVTWSVEGDAVTLDKTSGLSVTATGVKAGTATVTATAADGATAIATITVTEKSSSSGCSAGFGGIAALCALALLPLACGRRKK
ncbi:Ig-like domain-containing protein [Cloacibacillus evryensis]